MASPVPRDHGEAVPEKKKKILVRSPGCPLGLVARLPGWPRRPVARLAAARLRPVAFHYPAMVSWKIGPKIRPKTSQNPTKAN